MCIIAKYDGGLVVQKKHFTLPKIVLIVRQYSESTSVKYYKIFTYDFTGSSAVKNVILVEIDGNLIVLGENDLRKKSCLEANQSQ